jgi:hypothetical protein
LDEGKLSFPLLHYLHTQPETQQVREILEQRRDRGCMSVPLKKLLLSHLKGSRSLEYTADKLRGLERQITGEIGRLEALTGQKNWVLRLCMQRLSV